MSYSRAELHCFPEFRFGGFSRRDGTVAFYTRVRALTHPDAVVLDVGCGRGEYADDPVAVRRELRILRGRCATVIGLDPDPAAAQNPFLDQFQLLQGSRWPTADASIDLCLADWVLEHVEHPDAFLSECVRVLKPGGIFAARTTNACSPLGLAARLLPQAAHADWLRRLGSGRRPQDVFPTFHRCNRRGLLRRQLRRYQFESVVQFHEAEPAYLRRNAALYWLEFCFLRCSPASWGYTLLVFARRGSEPVGGWRPGA